MKSMNPLSPSRRVLASALLGITLLAVIPWQLTAWEAEQSKKETDTSETVAKETEPEQQKRTMRVRVVDPEGEPLAGAHIHASVWTDEEFNPNQGHLTDSDGWTTIILPDSLRILRLWSTKRDIV